MEANLFEVIETADKAQRDRMFQEFRNSTEANERQVVKFSSVREKLGEDGKPVGFEPSYFVAYPFKVDPQNHGSKRSPRKYPGRKVKA